MSLTKSFGGRLASAFSKPARTPSPSVLALGALDGAAIQSWTLFSLVGEESVQSSVDVALRCLRGILVADKDPDSRESSVLITLVLDGVGSVVCVDDPCAGGGRHVCQAVVRRRFPVHARAISLTEASELGAISFSHGLLGVVDSKAVSIGLRKV